MHVGPAEAGRKLIFISSFPESFVLLPFPTSFVPFHLPDNHSFLGKGIQNYDSIVILKYCKGPILIASAEIALGGGVTAVSALDRIMGMG